MTNFLPLGAMPLWTFVATVALLAFAAGLLAGWWGKEAQQRGVLFWDEQWRRVNMDWLAIYVVLLVAAAVVAWVVLE